LTTAPKVVAPKVVAPKVVAPSGRPVRDQQIPALSGRPVRVQRYWLVSLVVGVVALAVYLATLAPTLTWSHHGADGGDLITAACVLGVPHPPGYPLYVLIGHIFSRLPAGDLAFRFNLFSALSAAGASALLSAAIGRYTTPFAGLVGGLTFAFGPILWSQAVIVEVYTLNALLVAGLLLVILPPRRGRGFLLPPPRRGGMGGGILWGLSWTTHLTSILLFPMLLWAGVRCTGAERVCTKARPYVIGWLAGLTLFLLLPLLAARRPVINWGDPVTPARWWWVVSGALYRGYQFSLPWADWPGRVAVLARFAVQHFTWPGLGILLWGMARLARRDRPLCLALLASAVLVVLYALGYNTSDSDVLLIPVWMVAAVFFSVGLADFRVWSRWRPVGWLALAIPLYLLLTGWSGADLRHDREAVDFGRAVMAQSPPNALIHTATDAHTFALWYYRHAEGLRPDLTIVDKDMLVEDWYQTMLRAQDPRWPDQVDGRPVCAVSFEAELDCKSLNH